MVKSFLTIKRNLSEVFILKFWAIPFLDTDLSLLFTQTYNQYMGLARWNLLFNSEFRIAALKRGWVPVTTKETIAYKKSIRAFERVHLLTRILHWNDRRFYIEHIFYVKEEIRAVAFVEGLVRGPQGHLKPIDAFKAMGVTREPSPISDNLQGWIDLNYEKHENEK